MFWPTFVLAARSRPRQQLLRQLVAFRLLAMAAAVAVWGLSAAARDHYGLTAWLGWALLAAGIADGGALLGWRLAQLPKSPALEPLLLAPAPPWRTMLAEQAVGAALTLHSALAALPPLALLVGVGWLDPFDAAAIWALALAAAWALGLGLAWWSYEPRWVRRWGEGIVLAGTSLFVVFFGVLGDQALKGLARLPFDTGHAVRMLVLGSHYWNPFTIVHRLSRHAEQ